ncbi:transferrin isoform X1 [Drosophila sechellia]|uniref:Transferrin n=1 Tax=Drosophila sechellia TaxID=7238 RepID=B4HST7_DROSE|nr:transferrin isoform X1 [Drosophila sechellia]EDW48101.1 GM21673 [Drosophila sechellia]
MQWLTLILVVLFASFLSKSMCVAVQPPDDGKLRVCVVESRGVYRKTPKFCPLLEAKSNIECVIGVDRLDCVRRIHKGTAHFGVLTSEDLVAARWASVEILVASELRSHESHFEYEIVAVVDNNANIHTVHDLRGARLCHPGYGLGNHWTEVLANYFEAAIVSKTCDPEMTVTEDRIASTAKYFGPSCKAGPWVPDPKQDRILKNRYPSLCEMCYEPDSCDQTDKHWGRRGALYCLTSGGGNVAWARLDDVRSHFGFSGIPAQSNPSDFSYLCPNGHLQPLNASQPCVWVAKPWPVVAARRTHAAQVQRLVTGLSHDEPDSWQHALLSLLETYHVFTVPLDNVIAIDDYLDQATAFQSAYSFPECNPPRSIVFCTTSIIQHIKCSWLQEASQVYGVQPNIQCVRTIDEKQCLDNTKFKETDVVLVDQEMRMKAQRDYNLVPLLYEFAADMHDRYVTIALVHKDAKLESFKDLKGARACLPSFEGAAHLSVQETIVNATGKVQSLHSFFNRDSCLWNPQSGRKCPLHYQGDEGALRCLSEGADVAFLSSDVYKKYVAGNLTSNWLTPGNHKDFRVLCPYGGIEKRSHFEYCYLHWTTRGHLMTHNSSLTRRNEIYNSLRDMDQLFGRKYKSETRPFTLYGIFDKRNNVLFRDDTDGLLGLQELHRDNAKRVMEHIYDRYANTQYYRNFDESGATKSSHNLGKLLACLLFVVGQLFA